MKDPVPLDETDVDPGVKVVREVQPSDLGNRGRARWFYHLKNHDLPLRDIPDTQGHHEKTEPCIERKAENYCSSCLPENIGGFAVDDAERHLFLFTRCKNKNLEEHGRQFYVGYIDKRRILDINGRTAVQGPMKMVSFKEACPLGLVGNPDTRNRKCLNEDQTEEVLAYLSDAKNRYYEYLSEIEELEKEVSRPRYREEESVPPPKEDEILDQTSKGY